MRAIHFQEANTIYGKPDGMTDEQCYEISAYRGKNADGHPIIVTVWQPNKEDIEAINAGKPIILQFTCGSLPPHCLYTVDDKGEINE